MVLKIDHISYSCSDFSSISDLLEDKYIKEFEEIGLENVECKKAYLKLNSMFHNIYMYNTDDNGIPIEITQYPQVVNVNHSISFNHRKLIWRVKEIESAVKLFICFGAKITSVKENNVYLEMRPFLDKKELYINLIKDEQIEAPGYLDVEGWSSLGLFVDSVEKHTKELIEAGFNPSQISRISVNSKEMDVAFVKGKNGEIIEMVSLSRGRNKNENNRFKLHDR